MRPFRSLQFLSASRNMSRRETLGLPHIPGTCSVCPLRMHPRLIRTTQTFRRLQPPRLRRRLPGIQSTSAVSGFTVYGIVEERPIGLSNCRTLHSVHRHSHRLANDRRVCEHVRNRSVQELRLQSKQSCKGQPHKQNRGFHTDRTSQSLQKLLGATRSERTGMQSVSYARTRR
jgi:hypothetical protein